MIISLTVSIIWIKIDDSPFRHGFMASLGIIATPLVIVILSGYLQLIIWFLFKIPKWVGNPKKQKRVSLMQSIITYLIIIGFQVLLSVLLETMFIFYSTFVSNIVTILTLVGIFIVRDKLRGHYILWISSWIGISCLVFLFGLKYFWDFWGYNNQITSDGKIHMYTIIGLAIYHLFLTIYFRLRAEDQIPEEMK